MEARERLFDEIMLTFLFEPFDDAALEGQVRESFVQRMRGRCPLLVVERPRDVPKALHHLAHRVPVDSEVLASRIAYDEARARDICWSMPRSRAGQDEAYALLGEVTLFEQGPTSGRSYILHLWGHDAHLALDEEGVFDVARFEEALARVFRFMLACPEGEVHLPPLGLCPSPSSSRIGALERVLVRRVFWQCLCTLVRQSPRHAFHVHTGDDPLFTPLASVRATFPSQLHVHCDSSLLDADIPSQARSITLVDPWNETSWVGNAGRLRRGLHERLTMGRHMLSNDSFCHNPAFWLRPGVRLRVFTSCDGATLFVTAPEATNRPSGARLDQDGVGSSDEALSPASHAPPP
jgi:hypothetical protein